MIELSEEHKSKNEIGSKFCLLHQLAKLCGCIEKALEGRWNAIPMNTWTIRNQTASDKEKIFVV